MMRNGVAAQVLATSVALAASLAAMGSATPVRAQAANQLCGAAGLGAGCIGTATMHGMGGGGGGGGMGGMGAASNMLGIGLGILSIIQGMSEEAETSAAAVAPANTPDVSPDMSNVVRTRGYTATAPSTPSTTTDAIGIQKDSLLNQMRPLDGSSDAPFDPSNPPVGADAGVQAQKSALMNQMRSLTGSDEAISDNARAPFDTRAANGGNTAARQLCAAAGQPGNCIGALRPSVGKAPGGVAGGATPSAGKVASTAGVYVAPAALSAPVDPSNPPLDGGTVNAINPPVGGTTNADGSAPSLDSAQGSASSSSQPCNQITGYQQVTGAFGSSDVQVQIAPCGDGSGQASSTVANVAPPADGIAVDLDKPVPLLRAPSDPPSGPIARTDVPAPTVRETATNPPPDGYYLGSTIGEASAQWYADQYVATGQWRYAVGGTLASLWTPDTYWKTFTVLTLADAAGTYLGRPYWQYFPGSNPAYDSEWFTRGWGWEPPYTPGTNAISKLSLPPWNTADAIQPINPPWWRFVDGPRNVAPKFGQLGEGIEYHLGAFPAD